MRINYFGYFLREKSSGKRILFDIRPLLKVFCKIKNVKYKNSLKYNDENLYLNHSIDGLFVFLMTRSNEIIKKINSQNLSVDDLNNLFKQDEHLGFASYVMFKECYFSFGSTMLAPKFSILTQFINDILISLNIKDFSFEIEPLLHQATKQEILKMSFLGRTTIEISKPDKFWRDIAAQIGLSKDDMTDISSLEIVLKPKPRKNISSAVKHVLDKLGKEKHKPDKFIVKAKNELQPQLTELYLAGQGAIHDNIDHKQENKINKFFNEKINANHILKNKLVEFKENDNFKTVNINAVLQYSDMVAWPDKLSDL